MKGKRAARAVLGKIGRAKYTRLAISFVILCRVPYTPSPPFRNSPMSAVTIYHNPRCSKSRSTLALLQDNGIEPKIVLYLETPLDSSEIKALLKKLGIGAAELVRRSEDEYKASGLDKDSSAEDYVAAVARYPKLIERPIVVRGNKAVLGRPPENVLALID